MGIFANLLNSGKKLLSVAIAATTFATASVAAESFSLPQQRAEAYESNICNNKVYSHCLYGRNNPAGDNSNLSCVNLQPQLSSGSLWGCNPIFSNEEFSRRPAQQVNKYCKRVNYNTYFTQAECTDSGGQRTRKTWQYNGRVTTLPIAYSPPQKKGVVKKNRTIKKKYVIRGRKQIEYRRNSRGWYRYRSR
jgi:hypothetical protein